MKRTLIEETVSKIGERVKISGRVNSIRTHGKIIFLDLRDKTGKVQVVVNPKEIEEVGKEWVLEIIGEVKERPEKMINPDIKSGKIEIKAETITVLSPAKTLPFSIDKEGYEIDEERRMKYRYLDLRRERLQKNLKERHRVVHFLRSFLSKKNFIEVETPILTKSTPEGARDYLVPSRMHPGSFYALPQSPQQYKQLLMMGGVEKYFQFARCFRDEDLRADRQAEFTQLDIELSYVDQEDILNLMEEMFTSLVEKLFPEKKIKEKPFPRITYKEAMEKYKVDNPDLSEKEDELAFLFVVDFPMFDKREDGSFTSMHHPFTRPKEEDPKKIKDNPLETGAYQYDLVLNGNEIVGGSLRTYRKEIMEAVFQVLGHDKDDQKRKFGHFLDAFQYGVPPHGGIALGLDRFLMVLLGEENIREVIAFPKTGDGRELMMGTPSNEIDKKQLKELKIKVKDEKKK